MPIKLIRLKKIVNYFQTIHSFGYYRGWNEKYESYVDFYHLPPKQQKKIARKNARIFKAPADYTYRDFKDLELVYLGDNLLD
jgi:hypothetical protein